MASSFFSGHFDILQDEVIHRDLSLPGGTTLTRIVGQVHHHSQHSAGEGPRMRMRTAIYSQFGLINPGSNAQLTADADRVRWVGQSNLGSPINLGITNEIVAFLSGTVERHDIDVRGQQILSTTLPNVRISTWRAPSPSTAADGFWAFSLRLFYLLVA